MAQAAPRPCKRMKRVLGLMSTHAIRMVMDSELIRAFDETERPRGPIPASLTGHAVQFYRSDAHLVRTVSNFLADGLRAGQPLIVVATEAHRRAFADSLRREGLDTDELLSGREAEWLDARETLEVFMEAGMPDRELFMGTVGAVFERVLRKRHYLIVRGYGEMVDLLMRDGNIEGAVRLEELWNELAEKYAYSLLCGYSLDHFLHQSGAHAIR